VNKRRESLTDQRNLKLSLHSHFKLEKICTNRIYHLAAIQLGLFRKLCQCREGGETGYSSWLKITFLLIQYQHNILLTLLSHHISCMHITVTVLEEKLRATTKLS